MLHSSKSFLSTILCCRFWVQGQSQGTVQGRQQGAEQRWQQTTLSHWEPYWLLQGTSGQGRLSRRQITPLLTFAIQSPPEPTRVRSPEQLMMRSPDPLNWTVPLDTGKTFQVTQCVRENGESYLWRVLTIFSTLYCLCQTLPLLYSDNRDGSLVCVKQCFIFSAVTCCYHAILLQQCYWLSSNVTAIHLNCSIKLHDLCHLITTMCFVF